MTVLVAPLNTTWLSGLVLTSCICSIGLSGFGLKGAFIILMNGWEFSQLVCSILAGIIRVNVVFVLIK